MDAWVCCHCGRTMWPWVEKRQLRDGQICEDCLKDGGFAGIQNIRKYGKEQMQRFYQHRKELIEHFHPTEIFGGLEVDTNSHVMKVNDTFLNYTNLKGCHYGEETGVDGQRAAVFVEVKLKACPVSSLRLDFLDEPAATDSNLYQAAADEARSCQQFLMSVQKAEIKKIIPDPVIEREQPDEVLYSNSHPTPDEVTKQLEVLKALLYSGDMTKQEFEKIKKRMFSRM